MKRIAYSLLLGVVLGASPSAQGGTKEELVRLQTDVLALTNQIRLLEKTFSEQTEGLKGFAKVAQGADALNSNRDPRDLGRVLEQDEDAFSWTAPRGQAV